jgi:peptide/nickel transport system substrate-binding protein
VLFVSGAFAFTLAEEFSMIGRHEENELIRRSHLLTRAINRRDLLRALGAAGAGAALAGALLPAGASASGGRVVRRGFGRGQDTPVKGGTLIAAITGQPDNMDPHKASIYASGQVFDNIYSKLIEVDENLNYIPNLAASWTNPSPTEWVFTLVQNAVFHNGEKVTSKDVKYTFDRLKDPATASPSAVRFELVTSVEPVDDYTVKFVLSEPYGPFLASLAGFGGQIMNEKAVAAADPARNPVGCGPFKFVEWVTDDHLTLERWDQYFKEGQPYLDKVIFRGMGVDESRMAALQSGEVNWVDAIPLQKVAEVRDGGEFNYYTAATAGLPDYIAMNTSKPPFDNIKLRQAVAWAIDRPAILQLAYSGVGEVANEEVASGNAWHTGTTTYNAPDLDKAKALLAESGFDVNQKITYLGLPQYPELLRTGEIVKENLAAIGIQMEIEQQDVGVWAGNFLGKNYEITSGYWSSIQDPNDFYGLVLLSESPQNFTGYANPDLDTLIRSARSETDFDKRKATYKQIRDIVNQDVPLTFVHYELLNYATAKNVQGTKIYPSMELRFEDVWIAE